MIALRNLLWLACVTGAAICQAPTATREMRSSAGHDAERGTSGEAYTASHQVRAALTLQLTKADAALGGSVFLEFSAKRGSAEVIVRVPLAGTQAPVEAHECTVAANGKRALRYTAGVDAANFMAFVPSAKPKEINLLLNRYLCLAMAVPFDCAGKPVSLPERWDGWQLAGMSRLKMTSAEPATLKTSPVIIAETTEPFTKAQCPQGPTDPAKPR